MKLMIPDLINILIIDHNTYYRSGLCRMLNDHYNNHLQSVTFVSQYPCDRAIDLVLHAVNYGSIDQVCHYFPPEKPPPILFVIRDSRDYICPSALRCTRKSGTIYRDQPVDDILAMITETMLNRHYMPAKLPPSCGPCTNNPLSARECEVLRHLKRGNSQVKTAETMQLQVKTVNSHKRSAMRKLNFTRNNELLNWMLRGGLTSR
ncbi:Nitrogen regulation protein C [Serratia proteamaculans]|uniref:helix-turn-helix transcriptional regulator n=1 Tax=Serratia proteamaculans TaxID=28151 RepID=UPI002183BA28|nr:LuxR C-terminal-related transcriptional regulator [Serratia proteamaculans]CAI2537938.1 Nitrogen regulation protein C [Serratia proteamaculans]